MNRACTDHSELTRFLKRSITGEGSSQGLRTHFPLELESASVRIPRYGPQIDQTHRSLPVQIRLVLCAIIPNKCDIILGFAPYRVGFGAKPQEEILPQHSLEKQNFRATTPPFQVVETSGIEILADVDILSGPFYGQTRLEDKPCPAVKM